jgi:hypothetical protein
VYVLILPYGKESKSRKDKERKDNEWISLLGDASLVPS